MARAYGHGKELKIGYMPLSHATYWKFFPQHLEPAMKWAKTFKDYLSQWGKVYDTGNLVDCQARAREARLHFQANDVDVLIAASVTYSTPDDIMLDLMRFSRPIIVWNTNASPSIPPTMDFDMWMMDHGVTGIPGLTNLLVRENMPYFLISGHYTDPEVGASFSTALKAIQVARDVWGSRIGVFGHLYPGMLDFGYDPANLYTTFGVATVNILDSEVQKVFKEVGTGEVKALEEKMQTKYKVDDDFKGEEFSRSMQLAVAMKQVSTNLELDAFTVYCQSMWQHPEVGVVPCVGISLLTQEGVFASCEGDVLTALAGMILSGFTSNKAIFTEIWANDFGNNSFLMGHSGLMNLGLFENDPSSVKLSRHPWWTGCHGRGACLQLQMPPGQVTLLGICPVRGGTWRMVVTTGNVSDRPYVPLGAPQFFLKLQKPIKQFLDEFGVLGAAHHLSMAYGDWTEHLKALSKVLQIEYCYL